jgi:Domain of unknown function (DUF5658)
MTTLQVQSASSHHLDDLFTLNVALQMFDGVATYSGLHLGVAEANPILRHAFSVLGVVPALLLFKANACALLVLLHRAAPVRLGEHIFRFLAAVYCVCSLAPWLAKFLVLLSQSL